MRRELQSLLDACKREPEDDPARLVLADWLEEHGDESDRARADFVRLEMTSGVERGEPGFHSTWLRTWQANQERWGWPGPGATPDGRGLLIVRLHSHDVTSPEARAAAASEKWAWVAALNVRASSDQLARILDSPLLESVPAIRIDQMTLRPEAFSALARWPGLARLRELDLNRCAFPVRGVASLVRLPALQGLWSLSLAGVTLGPKDFLALRDPDVLSDLEGLDLSVPGDSAARAETIRLSRRRLRHLRMTGVQSPTEVAAVAGSAALEGLQTLDLSGSRLGDAALDDLAALPNLRSMRLGGTPLSEPIRLGRLGGSLRHLDLTQNHLGEAGMLALTTHGRAPTALVLYGCRIDDQSVAHLARWPGLASCRVLDLSANQITDLGLRHLTDSPHTAGLRSLRLAGNRIGAEGCHRLVGSRMASGLEELNLVYTDGGPEAARVFVAADVLPRMRELSLDAPRNKELERSLEERWGHLRGYLFPIPF